MAQTIHILVADADASIRDVVALCAAVVAVAGPKVLARLGI